MVIAMWGEVRRGEVRWGENRRGHLRLTPNAATTPVVRMAGGNYPTESRIVISSQFLIPRYMFLMSNLSIPEIYVGGWVWLYIPTCAHNHSGYMYCCPFWHSSVWSRFITWWPEGPDPPPPPNHHSVFYRLHAGRSVPLASDASNPASNISL